MEEAAIFITVFLISSVLGCGTCVGLMNYYRRRRGEPVYCRCLDDTLRGSRSGQGDSPEVTYTRLDDQKETNEI